MSQAMQRFFSTRFETLYVYHQVNSTLDFVPHDQPGDVLQCGYRLPAATYQHIGTLTAHIEHQRWFFFALGGFGLSRVNLCSFDVHKSQEFQ
jgi:hypothetical protein